MNKNKFLISEEKPIKEALKKIDDNHSGIIFIVNKKIKLLDALQMVILDLN